MALPVRVLASVNSRLDVERDRLARDGLASADRGVSERDGLASADLANADLSQFKLG